MGWTSNRQSCGVEWRRIRLQLVVWRQGQGVGQSPGSPRVMRKRKAKRRMKLRDSRTSAWRAREEEKLDSRGSCGLWSWATSPNAERWTGVCRRQWFLTLTLDQVTVVPSFVAIIVSAERRPHQRIIGVVFSSSLAQHPLPVLSGSNPEPNRSALPSMPVPSEPWTCCPHAETQANNKHPVHKMS